MKTIRFLQKSKYLKSLNTSIKALKTPWFVSFSCFNVLSVHPGCSRATISSTQFLGIRNVRNRTFLSADIRLPGKCNLQTSKTPCYCKWRDWCFEQSCVNNRLWYIVIWRLFCYHFLCAPQELKGIHHYVSHILVVSHKL